MTEESTRSQTARAATIKNIKFANTELPVYRLQVYHEVIDPGTETGMSRVVQLNACGTNMHTNNLVITRFEDETQWELTAGQNEQGTTENVKEGLLTVVAP